MEMAIGDKGWRLEIGDCLTMRLMPTGEFCGTTFYASKSDRAG
ncbi:hypothetical protein [Cupriavidus pauculus]|nr:hypothetical protein [Cupriavidus pauculus]